MDNSFLEFSKKEAKRERLGKKIILTISIFNYATAIINFAFNYTKILNLDPDLSTITTIVSVVLTTLLLNGFDWTRIWFGAVTAWNAIWLTFGFFVTMRELEWWANAISIILIIYYAVAACLLFASRSVKEYLYVRKNG